MAGRSNVGKSSMINAVTGVRGLAHVGKRPGRTQTLNFSRTDSFCLVDFAGYGYAEAPERVRAALGAYDRTISDLPRWLHSVILLIDARRGPTRDDLQIGSG